jgi:hypothetical protein
MHLATRLCYGEEVGTSLRRRLGAIDREQLDCGLFGWKGDHYGLFAGWADDERSKEHVVDCVAQLCGQGEEGRGSGLEGTVSRC